MYCHVLSCTFMCYGLSFNRKLEEVRGRLDQLRDLVQYYQAGNEFIHDDEHMSQSMITDNDDNQSGVRMMYL